jgi:drug/metabolite transporter (DMT)-like permease
MHEGDPEAGSWKGPMFILSAAVLWSAAGLGIKSLALPAMATAGFRSAFSLPVIAAFGSGSFRLALLKRPAVLATAVAYCLTICLFVAANRMTTAANAILLQYSSPVWVSLLSYPVLREKPHRRELTVAGVCLAGLGVFFLGRLDPRGLVGMILALGSGLAMACLVMGLRHEGRRGEESATGPVVIFGNLLCVVVGLPFMVATLPVMTNRDWLLLALLGTFQLGLAYVLFSAGLRRVPALRATVLGLIEPLLNPLWVAIGAGEYPGLATVAGGTVVLGCLVVDTLIPRRIQDPEEGLPHGEAH